MFVRNVDRFCHTVVTQQIYTCINADITVYSHNTKLSSKSSREDMCRLPTSFLLNIQSRVKQEVDMQQIQNCVTWYSSPYWCSVPNIRKLASVVPEINVTEIILWANLPMSTIFKVASNRKWTCRRFKTALHDTILNTDALCQISGCWPLWFPRKMWQKLSCMSTIFKVA